jgi:hypothetical protein
MGVDRTWVLAGNPSARRICASVARRRASCRDSDISSFRSVGPCCYRCSRPWHRIILICSGQDNSANNSAVMRFSRTKSSVAGTSYRERKMPRNTPYFLLVAQNAGNLGMREVFRSRPTSSAWPVGTQSAVLRSVTHPSHAGCGRSGSTWNVESISERC